MLQYQLDLKNARFLQKYLNLPISADTAFKERIFAYLAKEPISLQLADCAVFINETTAKVNELKKSEDALKEERANLTSKLNCLKQSMINKMLSSNSTTINEKGITISIIKGQPKVHISNSAALQPEFYREEISTKLNRALVRATLMQGKEVPGAKLKEVYTLKIRPTHSKA